MKGTNKSMNMNSVLTTADPTYGLWRVSSELDGTTRLEGIYLGYISDIASRLGRRGYYLNFDRVNPDLPKPTMTDESVCVTINDYLCPVKWEDSVKYWVEHLRKRDPKAEEYTASEGGGYRTIELEFSANTIADMKRARALAKLTKEEREILGL